MAETSRSRVTITLGCSGQVVKREGAVLDNGFSNSHPSVGSKRSVRDRLGTNVELNNKRHRGDGNRLSTSSDDHADDTHLREDDLRYKIMWKSGHKQTRSDGQQNGVDLREMLSRHAQRSTTSLGMQQLLPEARNGRQYMPDRKEVKQQIPEMRDVRQRIPETRDVRQPVPEAGDVRQRMLEMREVREWMPEMRMIRERMPEMREVRERMPEMREVREQMPEMREVRERMPEMREVREQIPETRDVRQHIPKARGDKQCMLEARGDKQRMLEARGDRQQMPEPTSASIMGRVPSARSVNGVPQMDSFRRSYFPWTLDRLRRRSPDGILGPPRGASPPRNEEKSRRRPLLRVYDDVRMASYLSKEDLELYRPIRTASYMAKPALAVEPAKPVSPMLDTTPPPGVIVNKNSYVVDEQHTVEGLLRTLGLGKYVINFKAEEVDMHALRQMGDNDLQELGIPMGPRKKILLALLSRSRRQV